MTTPNQQSRILEAMAERHQAAERAALPPTIGALFDTAVAQHGSRMLWVSVDGGQSLTYNAFATAVARCVAALHGLGVRRGTHVGLMLPSIPALAITWMALAKLGAVMVPINPRSAARELHHVLAEGDVALLVADIDHLPLLLQSTLPIPCDRIVLHGGEAAGFAGEWHSLCAAAGSSAALSVIADVDSDQLMTLQFTSGSTGAPKGCMLTHRYWITIGMARVQQGPAVQRMLIDMPFHYMGGQWRFLMALYLGATAYVARQPSLTHMLDRLLAHGIQFCSVTQALAKQARDPRRTGLELTWAGTMALPPDLHAPLEERLGGASVREMYGTTETGAALAVPVAVDWMRGSGSCGWPVPFRRMKIVDAQGLDLQPGGTGELLIQGPAMMLGYHKQEAATSDAFRDGWFRTGDLFRQNADGCFTLLGRIKEIIRRSGETISATELEAVLCGMPQIIDAAAVAVPDAMRGEEVKICVTLSPGLDAISVPPSQILRFCSERLAPFKLPRYVAYLPCLPKTPSGKIAKQSLRPLRTDLRLGAFDLVDQIWR